MTAKLDVRSAILGHAIAKANEQFGTVPHGLIVAVCDAIGCEAPTQKELRDFMNELDADAGKGIKQVRSK